MFSHPGKYASILVGGGPAGLAVLLSALRDRVLKDLLQKGLLLIERGPALGAGQIGEYVINSDSTGATFLDPLHAAAEPALRAILETPVAKRIALAGQGAVPLRDVGELMGLIGSAIRNIVREYPQSCVLTECEATSARQMTNGTWAVSVADASGKVRTFRARTLVLATGAGQPRRRLTHEQVAGANVEGRWGDRLMQSGRLLSQGGLEAAAKRLRGRVGAKVAILGGSTSAMAAAHALLHRLPDVDFAPGGITVFHRRPLRVYYTSREEAVADGYHEFGAEDVCPVTGRVYRFAGLRLDSRELLMRVRGIGGRPAEPRVALYQVTEDDPEALRRIEEADLVVTAFGYRPNALPLFTRYNRPITLFAETAPAAPLVDGRCRVLRRDGKPLSGVFGIGLASGYRPCGRFGGEPSFRGQANGLWLWQNGIGSEIAHAILAAEAKAAPRARTAIRSAITGRSMDLPFARTA